MRRILVILVVGVFFLIPATSWSKSDSEILLARVAALEAAVTNLQTAITHEASTRSAKDATLQNTVDGHSVALYALQQTDVNLQGAVSGLQTNVSGLQTTVAGLQGTTATLQANLTGLQGS